MHFYQIVVPVVLDQSFTYSNDHDIPLGQLVVVPFGTRSLVGFVDGVGENTFKGQVKNIQTVLPQNISQKNRSFLTWCRDYYMSPVGIFFKKMCGFSIKDFEKLQKNQKSLETPDLTELDASKVALNPEQEMAHKTISACENFQTFTLDGVTGSGKTEVYFECIAACLKKNQQILVLLPEIALSSQFLKRFERRFGFQPLLWHSNVTPKNKRHVFESVICGESCVVVGARSALFLPFSNLGLIVVDEEHDHSFKQTETPIYHARDAAIMRAKIHDIPIVLASATPSIETYHNTDIQKYQKLALTKRYGDADLADVALIDARHEKCENGIQYITPRLKTAMGEALSRGEQTLLFMNRRGYAPIMLCGDCGERCLCPTCNVSLVYHKYKNQLRCHYCDFFEMPPKTCKTCGSESIKHYGPGVERIAEEVKSLFPDAKTLMVVSDQLTTQKKYDAVFERIQTGDVDIIIGTQIMAKGHDFANITLIGVVDGDMSLNGVDLRASEKTFQLLHQVSGRAGRHHLKGHVFIQTHNPDHPVMQALKNNDRDGFLKIETAQRDLFHMPPFSKLSMVDISGTNVDMLRQTSMALKSAIPHDDRIMVMGPLPEQNTTIGGRHRIQFLMKSNVKFPRQKWIAQWLERVNIPPQIRLKIDIDPQGF